MCSPLLFLLRVPESLEARLFFSVLLLLLPLLLLVVLLVLLLTAAMLPAISWPRLSDLQQPDRDTTCGHKNYRTGRTLHPDYESNKTEFILFPYQEAPAKFMIRGCQTENNLQESAASQFDRAII